MYVQTFQKGTRKVQTYLRGFLRPFPTTFKSQIKLQFDKVVHKNFLIQIYYPASQDSLSCCASTWRDNNLKRSSPPAEDEQCVTFVQSKLENHPEVRWRILFFLFTCFFTRQREFQQFQTIFYWNSSANWSFLPGTTPRYSGSTWRSGRWWRGWQWRGYSRSASFLESFAIWEWIWSLGTGKSKKINMSYLSQKKYNVKRLKT